MSEEQLTVDEIAEQLKIHCPGSAFHADSKVHAELIANRFMDFTAQLLSQLTTIERDTGEKLESLYPAKCPITRRDFFMVIEHPEEGVVPTYGGPFDSFTIPEMGGEIHEDMHERELSHHRYDHDAGCWVEDETIPLRVIHEDNLGEKP